MKLLPAVLALVCIAPLSNRLEALTAQPQDNGVADAVEWTEGPAEVRLGTRAKLQLPEGLQFTGAEGTKALLEDMQNPTSGAELGLVLQPGTEASDAWFVVFEFRNSGYVPDDEKDELDADELLESLREGNEHANEFRKERGWSTLELVGWERPPFYDPKTNNLTWAIRGRSSEGGETVNWSVRILGRRGVMNVDLVLDPSQLAAALPPFDALLEGYSYTDGERYAEFVDGDKVAEYGLGALVVGGGAAIAAKTGLLAKFWKVIVAAVLGLGVLLKKGLGWITGRRGDDEVPSDPQQPSN